MSAGMLVAISYTMAQKPKLLESSTSSDRYVQRWMPMQSTASTDSRPKQA